MDEGLLFHGSKDIYSKHSLQTGPASRGSVQIVFGTELKRLRLAAGLTQEEVAAKAKVTREYVSMLEAEKNTPTIEVFIRLVRAVGASPAHVIAEVERTLGKG